MEAPILPRVARLVREYVCSSCIYEEILIMSRAVDPAATAGPIDVREYQEDAVQVEHLYGAIGHRTSIQRITQRFSQRLRFYEGRRNGELVATTWMVMPGSRFVDEIGLHLVVPAESIWIRDIFVKPQARGQGVFGAFVSAIQFYFHPHCRAVWSDVSLEDRSSLRAHVATGFKKRALLKFLHLGNRLMWRIAVPRLVEYAGGFKPDRRGLVTGKPFREYQSVWLA